MNKMNSLLGLGFGPAGDDLYSGTSTSSTGTSDSWWDRNKGDLLDIFKTGSQVYSNVKNPGSTIPGGSTPPPPPPTGMSMTTKVLLGVGATALVGGVVYFVTKGKKSK